LLTTLERRSFATRAKEGRVTVLAIDDDERQLELFRAALESNGFVVQTAATGQEGLDAARGGPFDLVLVDLVLPDLSGIEVITALRSEALTRDLPILLVTAHELTIAQRERLNGDVQAIMQKGSLQMEHLVREISRVLRPPELAP